ncbi:MAG: hypothetical protein ACHP9Z_27265 [Streptosporangiales bacterium]
MNDLAPDLVVTADGPIRLIELNRPEQRRRIITGMVRCPVPVIAAVSGPVVPGDETAGRGDGPGPAAGRADTLKASSISPVTRDSAEPAARQDRAVASWYSAATPVPSWSA